MTLQDIRAAQDIPLSERCWKATAWVQGGDLLLSDARVKLARYRYARALGADRVTARRYAGNGEGVR